LALGFAALLTFGLRSAAMELHLDMGLLYENQPALKALSSIIDSLGLQELLQADVGIWDAIWHMGSWALKGEVNSGIAFVMCAVIVCLFPVLDVMVLLLVTFLGQGDGSLANHVARRRLLAASRILRKVGMLDVCLVGVVLVTLSFSQMRGKGVVLCIREGTYMLIGAEVCHFLAAWLVARAFKPEPAACDLSGKECNVTVSEASDMSTDIESGASDERSDTESDSTQSAGEVLDIEVAMPVEV
jgi:hypothetical protein